MSVTVRENKEAARVRPTQLQYLKGLGGFWFQQALFRPPLPEQDGVWYGDVLHSKPHDPDNMLHGFLQRMDKLSKDGGPEQRHEL